MLIRKLKKQAWNWRGVIATVPIVTGFVIGVRLLGWLQPLEWTGLDTFFQLRPLEPQDKRIVIVGIKETDIRGLQLPYISDQVLATLLNKIKQQKPTAIGLDIYRDLPVNPGHENLLKVFRSTPNLVGIQKVIGDEDSKVAAPPELKRLEQVSSVDIVTDGDGVVRRGILYPSLDGEESIPSLGLALAAIYLQKQGIKASPTQDGWMQFEQTELTQDGRVQLKQTELTKFHPNDGGYVNADAGGYQILLNFRGSENSFTKVSLTDVLKDRVAPDLMRDRIVLIGVEAKSSNDFFLTPFSKGLMTTPIRTSGVEVQANLVSQILSSVLDNRPLLKVWSEPFEYLWIVSWITLIALLIWSLKEFSVIKFIIGVVVITLLALGTISTISYLAFVKTSLWIPVVSGILALCSSTITIIICIYIAKLQDANSNLELKIKKRTYELYHKNQQLEDLIQQLRIAQKQLIAQEKLAYLGTIISGVGHEIRNSVNLINAFNKIAADLTNNFHKELITQPELLNSDFFEYMAEYISDNFKLIENNLGEIKNMSNRTTDTINSMLLYVRNGGFERRQIFVNELIISAIKFVTLVLKFNYKNSDVVIETQYDNSINYITGVVEDLNRAIINLINNACYAVLEKKKVAGTEFNPRVLVTTKLLDSFLEICVMDNGQGIPSEILNRIFEPFFSTKPPGEGTGFGLFYTHEVIVEQHQGKIEVETSSEDGTKFIVLLPLN